MTPNHLIKRGGTWHFFRRVPKAMADLDARRFVKKAIKIKVALDPDGVLAAKRADILNTNLERDWHDMTKGRYDAARSHLRDAARRAPELGFAYRTRDEVTRDDIAEVLSRIDKLGNAALPGAGADIDSKVDRLAMIGGGERPTTMLSTLVEDFKARVKHNVRKKDKEQSAAFWQLRNDAVKYLLDVIGDKDVLQISIADAETFAEWWRERIVDRDIDDEGARKQFGALSTMIKAICARDKVKDPERFKGHGWKRSKGKRKAFAAAFVRDVILKPGALEGMPLAAFDVLMVCIETGARVSEVVNLLESHIHLTHNVPHISINDSHREVKTDNAIREVPLVGVALEAMRRNPKGFPQYRAKAGEASKEINKWLRALQPDVDPDKGGEFKTLHCLRHTFKDRLRAINATDEMKIALMGHHIGIKVADYGEGFDLENKLKHMNQIAFPT